jgi:hypothetical protein
MKNLRDEPSGSSRFFLQASRVGLRVADLTAGDLLIVPASLMSLIPRFASKY